MSVVRLWHRFPREVVAALEVLKAWLDRAWSDLVYWKVSLVVQEIPMAGVGLDDL